MYKFNKQIEKDQGKKINKADAHKMFVYTDHEDTIMYYSNLFNHNFFKPMDANYVPFASVILIELHKLQDGKYYTNASINAEPVTFPGPCDDQLYCEFT